MKGLLKFVIAAAVVYACFQGSRAAWKYYQFKDATYQTILFGSTSTIGALQEQILRRAAEFEVPIQPQDLEITRDGPRTVARASYTEPVEILPSYTYPFKFHFQVDALSVRPTTAEDVIPPQ